MKTSHRYLLLGVLLGFLFPAVATLTLCFQQDGTISLETIAALQSSNLLLWIIDSAPFFLGALAWLAGSRQQGIDELNQNLHKRIEEQTAGIRAINENLIGEIEIRKKKEEELIEAKNEAEEGVKAKDQFLSNMSHEIRTPMNGILGMTDILLNTMLTEEQRKYLSAIDYSAKNLLVIINDILDLSKINAEKLEFEKVNFRIMDVVSSVENTLKFKAHDKGINFNIIIDKKIPDVMLGDPVRLSQIILNIAGNAVKFTEKGAVEVFCQLNDTNGDGYQIQTIVKDTGIGIPQDKIATIFESFGQVSAKITNKFGGTGLGLPISKKLIEQQGGEMIVTSEEGAGSTFTFTLQYGYPITEVEEKEETFSVDIEKVDNSAIRILVAEDNQINQIVAKTVLQRFGFQVEIVENGLLAIDALRKNHYDIILMDVHMPEMDGLEATRQIRTELESPKRDVKIMAMTASVLKKEIDKCFDAGMDDYMAKPFVPKLLHEKIMNMLYKVQKVA